MRLRVDPVMCQGYGLCAQKMPELFALDEWGYGQATPGHDDDSPEFAERARAAIAACPVKAIRVVDNGAPPPPDHPSTRRSMA